MFLSRLHLDPRCRDARRDLADPYQLHSTLCRAFSKPDIACPQGAFMWRLEPETDAEGLPLVIVQSRTLPNWDGIGIKSFIAKADPPVDLRERLHLDSINTGARFRFRLRANPCLTRGGKRLGLMKTAEQEQWIKRQGDRNGFSLPQAQAFYDCEHERIDVQICQQQTLRAKQHTGNTISIFSALYDGMLTVTEPTDFIAALAAGIGHGKGMGLGLLSVAPSR